MLDILTLSQMQMFVAVADAGSFRAGAARLHRVQSAVSHAIANLEEQLQVRLFDRSGHKPVLTPTGKALLGDVRVILSKVEALRSRAGARAGHRARAGSCGGHALSAGAPGQRAAWHACGLPEHCHPRGIQLDGRHRRCIEFGPMRSRHCGLRPCRRKNQPRIPHAASYRGRCRAVACAGGPCRPARCGGLDAAAAEHVQIVVEDPSTLSQGYDIDVLSPSTWRVTDMYIKLALLRAGLGWGKMPSWLVAGDLAAGTLVQLPVSRIGPGGGTSQQCHFCHRGDKTLGAGATLLRECLMAEAKAAAPGAGGASASPRARRSPRSAAPAPRPATRRPAAARGR